MSGKSKLAGALGVAELLEADLRKPLPPSPTKQHPSAPSDVGYPKTSCQTTPMPAAKGKVESKTEKSNKLKKTVGEVPAAVRPKKTSAKDANIGHIDPIDVKLAPTGGSPVAEGSTPTAPPAALESTTQSSPSTSSVSGVKGKGVEGKGKASGTSKVVMPRGGYANVAAQSLPKSDISPSAQCSISEGYGSSEIRTKVFRIGAPLLRSTIPVTLGSKSKEAQPSSKITDEKDGSDVETILSLSDGECDHEGQLSVTLDFPC